MQQLFLFIGNGFYVDDSCSYYFISHILCNFQCTNYIRLSHFSFQVVGNVFLVTPRSHFLSSKLPLISENPLKSWSLYVYTKSQAIQKFMNCYWFCICVNVYLPKLHCILLSLFNSYT